MVVSSFCIMFFLFNREPLFDEAFLVLLFDFILCFVNPDARLSRGLAQNAFTSPISSVKMHPQIV